MWCLDSEAGWGVHSSVSISFLGIYRVRVWRRVCLDDPCLPASDLPPNLQVEDYTRKQVVSSKVLIPCCPKRPSRHCSPKCNSATLCDLRAYSSLGVRIVLQWSLASQVECFFVLLLIFCCPPIYFPSRMVTCFGYLLELTIDHLFPKGMHKCAENMSRFDLNAHGCYL